MSIDFCAITHVSLVHANTAASDLDSVPWKHDIYIYICTHTHAERHACLMQLSLQLLSDFRACVSGTIVKTSLVACGRGFG